MPTFVVDGEAMDTRVCKNSTYHNFQKNLLVLDIIIFR